MGVYSSDARCNLFILSTFLDDLLSGDRDAIILAAAGYFALMGMISLVVCFRLSRWPSVVGVLHEEGIDGSLERSYTALVRYSYSVDGVTYEGNRLSAWYMMVTHNLRALLKLQFRLIERHEGANVTVFYNPRKPQKSYLDVPGWRSVVVHVGLFFGSVALLLSAM